MPPAGTAQAKVAGGGTSTNGNGNGNGKSAAAGPVKHRACDECRSRKLACSKEPDGCTRCKREGIRCVYSPQKPMGRPRKRPHLEVAEPEDEEPPAYLPMPMPMPVPAPDAPVASFPAVGGLDDSMLTMDMSFMDVGGTDLDFLDLLGGGFGTATHDTASLGDHQAHIDPLLTAASVPATTAADRNGSQHGHGQWSYSIHDINFADDARGPVELGLEATHSHPHGQDLGHAWDQHTNSAVAVPPSGPASTDSSSVPVKSSPPEATPSLSSQGSSPEASGPEGSPSQHPAVIGSTLNGQQKYGAAVITMPSSSPCGCLASLYLALDSLAHLPTAVGPAMRVARHAAKAAHDCTLCPSCSPPDITNPLMSPPVQAFQSMMMMGALLPSLANAYNRILGMVDAEASRAEAENRRLAFSIEEYGGLWGRMAQASPCHQTSGVYDQTPLEPALWRRTVRGLLRVDVYGINTQDVGMAGDDERHAFVQIGLKDIIRVMETRSKTRHATMDKALADGIIANGHPHGHHPPPPGGKHTCMQIIDIAKHSIDALVIP